MGVREMGMGRGQGGGGAKNIKNRFFWLNTCSGFSGQRQSKKTKKLDIERTKDFIDQFLLKLIKSKHSPMQITLLGFSGEGSK